MESKAEQKSEQEQRNLPIHHAGTTNRLHKTLFEHSLTIFLRKILSKANDASITPKKVLFATKSLRHQEVRFCKGEIDIFFQVTLLFEQTGKDLLRVLVP